MEKGQDQAKKPLLTEEKGALNPLASPSPSPSVPFPLLSPAIDLWLTFINISWSPFDRGRRPCACARCASPFLTLQAKKDEVVVEPPDPKKAEKDDQIRRAYVLSIDKLRRTLLVCRSPVPPAFLPREIFGPSGLFGPFFSDFLGILSRPPLDSTALVSSSTHSSLSMSRSMTRCLRPSRTVVGAPSARL